MQLGRQVMPITWNGEIALLDQQIRDAPRVNTSNCTSLIVYIFYSYLVSVIDQAVCMYYVFSGPGLGSSIYIITVTYYRMVGNFCGKFKKPLKAMQRQGYCW